jgi:hypothetical protein
MRFSDYGRHSLTAPRDCIGRAFGHSTCSSVGVIGTGLIFNRCEKRLRERYRTSGAEFVRSFARVVWKNAPISSAQVKRQHGREMLLSHHYYPAADLADK